MEVIWREYGGYIRMTGGCIGIWRLFKRLGGYIRSRRLSETRVGIELLGQLKMQDKSVAL